MVGVAVIPLSFVLIRSCEIHNKIWQHKGKCTSRKAVQKNDNKERQRPGMVNFEKNIGRV